MESIAVVSRSVFSSKRGSRQLDELTGIQDLSRRGSIKNQNDFPAEDKIALPDTSLHESSQDLNGDSMKFPAVDPVLPTSLTTDAFGADFGKPILEDEHFKALGLDGSFLSAPTIKAAAAADGSSDKIPALDTTNNIEWKTNVFELDVSANKSRSSLQPGLIPRDEEEEDNNGLTEKELDGLQYSRSQEIVRPSDSGTSNRHIRKATAPILNETVGNDVVKPKRPLSGFSVKSLTAAFARGSDAPEVVPPRPLHSREGENNQIYDSRHVGSQQPPPSQQIPQSASRNGYDSRYQLDSRTRHQHQFSGTHNLRSMQSSPALNRAAAASAGGAAISSQTPTPNARPLMTRRPSAGSLRSTISNINKPLPPEPPGLDVAAASRATVVTTPRTVVPSNRRPSNLQPSIPSSPARQQQVIVKDRSKSASAASGKSPLQSRYARDLDALDNAFARGDKTYYVSQTPATAADMTFRDQLDTIRESPRGSLYQETNGPIQVPRHTGRLEPTRKPPPTPKSRGLSPARELNHSRAQSIPSTPRRPSLVQPATSQSRLDIATQQSSKTQQTNSDSTKTDETRQPETRSSESPTVYLGGGRQKLEKLLGEAHPADDTVQERRPVVRPQLNIPRDSPEDTTSPQDNSQPMTRKGSVSGVIGTPFRTGTSDAQFDEIRKRLELLSPSSAGDSPFISTQVVGTVLSTQQAPSARNRQQSDDSDTQPRSSERDNKEGSESSGGTLMSPVELPADMTWAAGPIQETYEMDATEMTQAIARVPIPPIPESPKNELKRSTTLQRHSTVSSGSGRTKSLRSVKSARSARSAKARSMGSLAVSEIQELYAGLPSPRATLASNRPSIGAEESIPELPPMPEVMTTEELEEKDVISADQAEQVLYQILRNLYEPEDLLNASLVSRGFQRTFRRHDTKLLRHALWYTSGPAWEYLEMHMPISADSGQLEYPANVYREQYIEDMRIMATLKSLILRHCGSILSRATTVLLCANSTRESAPVDDAIWRIWTFCKIFGEDSDKREDLEMQKRWIKGQTMLEAQVQGGHRGVYSIKEYPAFAFGNDEGLTPEELIRMGEIWLCLRRLVRGYRGQRGEAREYGIFEGAGIMARDDFVREEAILDEWTIHLLSLAPGTNVDVLAPVRATTDNFIKAEELGYTSWTPPGRNFTSSGFLTGPICSVLEEWLETEPGSSPPPAPATSGASSMTEKTTTTAPSRQTVEGFVSHIRTSQDGREFRKLLNGAPRPELTVNVAPSDAQRLLSEKGPALKSAKEGKKSAFGKFTIKMPSRSQTTNKSRSKALATRQTPKNGTAAPSPSDDGPLETISPGATSGSRLDLIRNLTQRTRKNSTARDERPANGIANTQAAQNGRISPSDGAKSNISSQATLSTENDYAKDASYPITAMPIRLAAERLREEGFEPSSVDKIILESSSNGVVNYERALKKMKKNKLLRERLMRLDRMG